MTDTSTTDTQAPEVFDPFEGNSKHYTITKPVNLTQLIEEINSAVGKQVQVVLAGIEPGVDPSDSTPAVLIVYPASADQSKVQSAIDAHTLDPNFGLSQDEVTTNDLRAKVASGEPLSQDEINTALRILLLGSPAVDTSTTTA